MGACGINLYLVCVFCVQEIARHQKELADHFDLSEGWAEDLEHWIQHEKKNIQTCKQEIVQFETELAKIGKPREFLWLFHV